MHAGGLKLAIWEDSCELEVWRNEFLQARHDSVEGVSTLGYFTKKGEGRKRCLYNCLMEKIRYCISDTKFLYNDSGR